ncbi:MAG: translocation/assembly module TamB domain-containing protein [Syntrophothermus sp.]
MLLFSISYAGVYFWLNSPAITQSIRHRVESELRKATGWNFSLGRIEPGMISRVVFSDVRISFEDTAPQAPDLSVKQVVVSYNLFKLLARRDVLTSINRVDLAGPRLRLSRDPAGRWNLQTALGRLPSGAGKAPAFTATVTVRGGEISVTGWNPKESGWLERPGFDLFEPEDRPFNVKFSDIDGRLKLGQDSALNLRLVARSGLEPGALLAMDGAWRQNGGMTLRVQAKGLGLQKPFGVAAFNPKYGRFKAGQADLDIRLQRSQDRAGFDYSTRIDLSRARYLWPGTDLLADIQTGRILFDQRGKVNGELDMRYAGSGWRVAGGFAIEKGQVGSLDLAVMASGFKLAEIQAVLERMGVPTAGVKVAGTAGVNTRIGGSWREPRLYGSLELNGATVEYGSIGGPLTDLNGKITFNGAEARINELTAQYLGAEVNIGGRITGFAHPRVALAVGVRGMELGRFQTAGAGDQVVALKEFGVDGRVDLDAMVDGLVAQPVVRGQLRLQSGEIHGIAVQDLKAGFTYKDLAFQVDPFLAELIGGTLKGSLAGRFIDGMWRYELEGKAASLQIAELGRLWPQAKAFEPQGRLGGDLVVKGTYSPQKIAELAGTVEATGVTMGNLPLGELRAGFAAHDRGLILDYAVLSGPNGQISASGRLAPDGKLAVDLAGEGVNLGRILEEAARWTEKIGGNAQEVLRFVLENGAGGTLQFVGQLAGPATAPALTGSLQIDHPVLRGQEFDRLAGRIAWNGRDLGIHDLELTRGRTSYAASGEIGVGQVPELALNLQVKGAQARELMDIAGLKWDLSGEVNAGLMISGSSKAPVVDGNLRMASGLFFGEPVEELSSGFRYEAGTLLVKSLDAHLAGGVVTASGGVAGQRLNLSVGAKGLDLAGLNFLQGVVGKSQLQGQADLEGTITGTLREPQASGYLHTGALRIRGYQIDGMDGQFYYRGKKLNLAGLEVRFAGGRAGINGEVALAPVVLNLHARMEDGDLDRMLRMAGTRSTMAVKGRVTGSVHVWGSPENPSAQMVAQLQDGLAGKMALSGDLDALLQDREITVRKLRLSQGKGLLTAAGAIGLRKEISFEAEAKDFDLSMVNSLLGLPYDLQGRTNMRIALRGNSSNPDAELWLNIADSSINGVTFELVEGNVAVKDGLADVQEIILSRDGQKAKVYGQIPLTEFLAGSGGARGAGQEPARLLDLHVEVPDGDLGWMGAFYKDLKVPRGTGGLKLHITGPLRQPQIAGEMWMKGATVTHPALGAGLTNLSAEALIRGNLVEVKKASANWSGGVLTAAGNIELAGLKPAAYDLSSKISGVHYPDPFLDMVIDGNIRIVGPASLPLISGEVFLSRTRLTLGARSGGRGMGSFNARLDLAVKNRNEVHIVDTIGATDAWAYGELALRGTIKEPTLSGRADSTRGTFGYLDAEFQITDAYAEFTPQRGLLPLINVRGESMVDNYTITATISGVVGNLSMDFSSSPPLSRDEIMSMLGLPGKINRLFKNNPDGVTLNDQLAELLQDQIQTQVFGSLRKAVKEGLQLDDFRIEPGFGEEKLRFQFGKYVLNNLYITYSRTFSSQRLNAEEERQFAQQFIKFEYRIRPNVLFSTSFTDTGDTRLGLEAKLRF